MQVWEVLVCFLTQFFFLLLMTQTFQPSNLPTQSRVESSRVEYVQYIVLHPLYSPGAGDATFNIFKYIYVCMQRKVGEYIEQKYVCAAGDASIEFCRFPGDVGYLCMYVHTVHTFAGTHFRRVCRGQSFYGTVGRYIEHCIQSYFPFSLSCTVTGRKEIEMQMDDGILTCVLQKHAPRRIPSAASVREYVGRQWVGRYHTFIIVLSTPQSPYLWSNKQPPNSIYVSTLVHTVLYILACKVHRYGEHSTEAYSFMGKISFSWLGRPTCGVSLFQMRGTPPLLLDRYPWNHQTAYLVNSVVHFCRDGADVHVLYIHWYLLYIQRSRVSTYKSTGCEAHVLLFFLSQT